MEKVSGWAQILQSICVIYWLLCFKHKFLCLWHKLAWEKQIRHSLLVLERGELGWEEFAPFAGLLHVFYEFGTERFVLALLVLFVEDAVSRFFCADAAEQVAASVDEGAVCHVAAAVYDHVAVAHVVCGEPRACAFDAELHLGAAGDVVAVFRVAGEVVDPFQVFAAVAFEARMAIFAVFDRVAGAVFAAEEAGVFARVGEVELGKFFLNFREGFRFGEGFFFAFFVGGFVEGFV